MKPKKPPHHKLLLALITITLTALCAATQASSPPKQSTAWSVRWQPTRLVNGAPVAFQVTTPPLDSLSGKWLEHEVSFSFDLKSKTWYGIAGISLQTHPGSYRLELKGTTAGGKEISFSQVVAVTAGKYASVAVTVPKKYTEPSAEQLVQIAQDKEAKEKVFAQRTPEREWAGDFLPPATAPISDVFGTRRIFNGKTQSTHQGLDYRVPEGTPVSALNAGTIVLARPLYFEGNCVIIDHGQGLLTLYLHLSQFKVKEGDHVSAGQEIALSGGTGRASGPHLHLAVRWQGIYLNPATLLSVKLP